MNNSSITALVLAAGKGTRMKSSKAKVLHEVLFTPMVHHVLDALQPLALNEIIVVTGHQSQAVKDSLQHYNNVTCAHQVEQLGTGHAVLSAKNLLIQREGAVLILCGDTPLIQPETLGNMVSQHHEKSALLSVMTMELDDPTHYGRVITNDDGNILQIIEEKDASEDQRLIKEANAGIYCADIAFLYDAIEKVGTDNQQGEVYLTDIVGIANNSGVKVNKFVCNDPTEVHGVNSRNELAIAHKRLQERRNQQLMTDGVTLVDPETIWIAGNVSIGMDTVVQPSVQISGKTIIGKNCTIEPFCMIHDCTLGDGVIVGAFSLLEGCHLGNNEKVAVRTNLLHHE